VQLLARDAVPYDRRTAWSRARALEHLTHSLRFRRSCSEAPLTTPAARVGLPRLLPIVSGIRYLAAVAKSNQQRLDGAIAVIRELLGINQSDVYRSRVQALDARSRQQYLAALSLPGVRRDNDERESVRRDLVRACVLTGLLEQKMGVGQADGVKKQLMALDYDQLKIRLMRNTGVGVKQLAETPIQRLLFRGDDRAPADIFAAGFQRRQEYINMQPGQYRDAAFAAGKVPKAQKAEFQARGATFAGDVRYMPKAGDLDPKTGICVSPRLCCAALFPLKSEDDPPRSDTWIYGLYLERGYNTHEAQVHDGLRGIGMEIAMRRSINFGDSMPTFESAKESTMGLWFANELCARQVSPAEILCAIRCTRSWIGTDWTAGAHFSLDLDSLVWNERSNKIDPKVRELLASFIEGEAAEKEQTTPRMSSGYRQAELRGEPELRGDLGD
jgi:hypothetical protein